ncbi:MAG TPA: adenine deaminase [Syntrophobacteraceae bacterium]|nr:adenine deaminase [Syntrophobacteraceae bacterium]
MSAEFPMKLDSMLLQELLEVARGHRPADLCFCGGQVINVFSGHIDQVDLAIHRGFVVGSGSYAARERVELDGAFVAPGFIDGHLHIESTLLSPDQFCAAVLPHGTSAVVADPHEIANVLGVDGIRYFLAATEHLPLDVFFNLPSCVPASPLETSGATLRACDLHSLLPHPRIIGLAEMMNFPGLIHAVPEVLDKVLLFQDLICDGHAPQLSGLGLNAYLTAGIRSDHECTALVEAREKLDKGMVIMLREGSQSKDLAQLLPLVDQHTWPRCMLVSDDCHPDDLIHEGHMNAVINRAMSLGLDPILAITLATWTPAAYFRLARRGALAPGYQADFSISPTLNPWKPQRVFKNGQEVASEGRLLIDPESWPQPQAPASPMCFSRLAAGDLAVTAQAGRLRVIGVQEGSLLTRSILVTPKISGGEVIPDLDHDILKLVVCNRYQPDKPPAVGFIQGFGLTQGAIATTVAHDAHNIIAVGTSDDDILAVVESLRQTGGGMAIGSTSEAVTMLPLPLAGLMSTWPVERVSEQLELLKRRARSWGSPLKNPFLALSFMALGVIPELKLTDLGLVDVTTFSLVPLFESG